jgi:hypothetical protein
MSSSWLLPLLGTTIAYWILARLATMLLRPAERPRSWAGLLCLYGAEAGTVSLAVSLWR